MKHDLLVLLLLPFGCSSSVAQTSGEASEDQSIYGFQGVGKGWSFSDQLRRFGILLKMNCVDVNNTVIFNFENVDNQLFKVVELPFLKKMFNLKQLF